MRRHSTIIVAGTVIMAILGFAGSVIFQNNNRGNHTIAVIKHNNQVIESIDLDSIIEPRNLTISGDYHNIIHVEKGRIRFEEADCPDKICVHTGWLTKYGDIGVCLPNKALITIEKH